MGLENIITTNKTILSGVTNTNKKIRVLEVTVTDNNKININGKSYINVFYCVQICNNFILFKIWSTICIDNVDNNHNRFYLCKSSIKKKIISLYNKIISIK